MASVDQSNSPSRKLSGARRGNVSRHSSELDGKPKPDRVAAQLVEQVGGAAGMATLSALLRTHQLERLACVVHEIGVLTGTHHSEAEVVRVAGAWREDDENGKAADIPPPPPSPSRDFAASTLPIEQGGEADYVFTSRYLVQHISKTDSAEVNSASMDCEELKDLSWSELYCAGLVPSTPGGYASESTPDQIPRGSKEAASASWWGCIIPCMPSPAALTEPQWPIPQRTALLLVKTGRELGGEAERARLEHEAEATAKKEQARLARVSGAVKVGEKTLAAEAKAQEEARARAERETKAQEEARMTAKTAEAKTREATAMAAAATETKAQKGAKAKNQKEIKRLHTLGEKPAAEEAAADDEATKEKAQAAAAAPIHQRHDMSLPGTVEEAAAEAKGTQEGDEGGAAGEEMYRDSSGGGGSAAKPLGVVYELEISRERLGLALARFNPDPPRVEENYSGEDRPLIGDEVLAVGGETVVGVDDPHSRAVELMRAAERPVIIKLREGGATRIVVAGDVRPLADPNAFEIEGTVSTKPPDAADPSGPYIEQVIKTPRFLLSMPPARARLAMCLTWFLALSSSSLSLAVQPRASVHHHPTLASRPIPRVSTLVLHFEL